MPFQPDDHIRTILDNLPMKPGCYIMKNDKGKIIYIGKAKYLRHRVRSYFTVNADGTRKTLKMRAQVRDIDYIITENEVKALILEDADDLDLEFRPRNAHAPVPGTDGVADAQGGCVDVQPGQDVTGVGMRKG